MTFRQLHSWTFATVPLLGIACLHVAAVLPAPISLASTVLLLTGLALSDDVRARVPPLVTGSLPIALAVVAAAAVARNGDPVVVAVAFSVALQLLRVFTRAGASHDLQIFILALLHVVAAAVLGGSLGFGVCLATFVLVSPAALTLSHLRREVERNYEAGAKDRAGRRVDVERIMRSKRVVEPAWVLRSLAIAPFVLAFTALLFLVVPRVGLAMFLLKPPSTARIIGFSDKVDLGSLGPLEGNETLAARIDWTPPGEAPAPMTLPFFLRGTAFDSYDGRAWRKTDASAGEPVSLSRGEVNVALGPRPAHETTLRIRLEAMDPHVLFIPSGARRLGFEPNADFTESVLVHSGPEGEWRYEARQAVALTYRVSSESDRTTSPGSLSTDDRARYLQLPAALDNRVSALAQTAAWSGPNGGDVRERAGRIAAFLRESFSYSTAAPSGGQDDPLAHFLFTSRAGHCEFFSTALAVMLRTQGIPARNVTGFAGAQRNTFGNYYSVRQQNAHSWVEYWRPLGERTGRWETLDATPVATREPPHTTRLRVQEFYEALAGRWDRHVAAFDLSDQARMAESLSRPIDRLTRFLKTMAARPTFRIALFVVVFAVAALLLRRRTSLGSSGAEQRTLRRDALNDLLSAIESSLAPFGTRAFHETPREFVARVAPAHARPRYDDALAFYEEGRFAGAATTRERLAALTRAVRAIHPAATAADAAVH